MSRYLVAALAVMALSWPPLAAQAASRPSAMFAGQTPADVSGRLASMCIDRGHVVTDTSPYAVVCKMDINLMGSVLLQVMLGNSYSTTPEAYVRFTISAVGPDTRVQAYEWVETTMAFGQKRTMEMTNGREMQKVQALLDEMATSRPPTAIATSQAAGTAERAESLVHFGQEAPADTSTATPLHMTAGGGAASPAPAPPPVHATPAAGKAPGNCLKVPTDPSQSQC